MQSCEIKAAGNFSAAYGRGEYGLGAEPPQTYAQLLLYDVAEDLMQVQQCEMLFEACVGACVPRESRLGFFRISRCG